MKTLSMAVMAIGLCIACFVANAQTKRPLIKATKNVAVIQDGEHVKVKWHLDPKAKPDVYYVNIPRRKSKVTFQTDQGKLSFKTHYGESYDFVVLLNEKDSCFVRIVARDALSDISLQLQKPLPDTIPFTLIDSRIYIQGLLNEKHNVNIQFDLGAGGYGCAVNKMSSGKLNLSFNATVIVSNTQGIHEARKSTNNKLTIGNLKFSNISIAEVGNMDPYEDLFMGNGLFRDKIIEFDYDKKVLIVQDNCLTMHLPFYNKTGRHLFS